MEKTFFNNVTSNYEMFFTPAGSCQMDGIVSLYNYIMSYLTSILCIVTTALVFIIIIHIHGERHLKQFKTEEDLNELLNWLKYLQRWTHSTILELVWTIIPTIILIAIAIPSFILLYSLDEIVDTQSVVKIIAYQWYWKYEYPVMDIDNDDIVTFSYLSYMLPFDDLTAEKNWRLLEVDAPLVLPTNVNSKLVITAKDVLHSFAIPALGIKMDAVPGRLNQITVHIFKSGMFYGQCSELCGVNHGFMPIVLAAVDFNIFEHFLSECSGVSSSSSSPDITPQPSPSDDKPSDDKPSDDKPSDDKPSDDNPPEAAPATQYSDMEKRLIEALTQAVYCRPTEGVEYTSGLPPALQKSIDACTKEERKLLWMMIHQLTTDVGNEEVKKIEELPSPEQETYTSYAEEINWNGGIDGISRAEWLKLLEEWIVDVYPYIEHEGEDKICIACGEVGFRLDASGKLEAYYLASPEIVLKPVRTKPEPFSPYTL